MSSKDCGKYIFYLSFNRLRMIFPFDFYSNEERHYYKKKKNELKFPVRFFCFSFLPPIHTVQCARSVNVKITLLTCNLSTKYLRGILYLYRDLWFAGKFKGLDGAPGMVGQPIRLGAARLRQLCRVQIPRIKMAAVNFGIFQNGG